MDEKVLLHAKRWDLYLYEKEKLVKGKYSVEVAGHDNEKCTLGSGWRSCGGRAL